jgi:hypothetical protein
MVLKPSGRITRIAFGITTELKGREREKKREGSEKERETVKEREGKQKKRRVNNSLLFFRLARVNKRRIMGYRIGES